MKLQPSIVCVTTFLLCFALPGAPSWGDQPLLRLTGVPSRLVLPLPDGSNQILTARITGAAVASVWMAKKKDAKLRVLLDKVADGEYQINLAGADVAAVLQDGSSGGRFRVFAKLDNGKVLSSVPIRYTHRMEGVPFRPTRCRLYGDNDDLQATLPYPGVHWIDAHDVRRIDFPLKKTKDHLAPVSLKVSVGYEVQTIWDRRLERRKDALSLSLTPEIRKAWREQGQLRVESSPPFGMGPDLVLKLRPRKLSFPGNLATMEIHQRRAEAIPGSSGYLTVSLGDITAGQVMLTLSTDDGKTPINRISVRSGDSLTFKLHETEYVLYVRKLVNLLIGDDWAVIDVSQVPSDELKAIDHLLAYIEKTQVTFAREGKAYSGRDAALHLRQKLAAAGPRVRSIDEFIDKIASRSSITGKPYLVTLPDGSNVPARQWLKDAATKSELDARKEGDGRRDQTTETIHKDSKR